MPAFTNNYPSKDATLIVLDVSPNLVNNKSTLFSRAQFIASRYIENSLLIGSKQNLFGLIFAGTYESSNPLEYDNLIVMKPMTKADFEFFEMIKNASPDATAPADENDNNNNNQRTKNPNRGTTNIEILDTLLLALHILVGVDNKQNLNYNKRIVFITALESAAIHGHPKERFDKIKSTCVENCISLDVVALDYEPVDHRYFFDAASCQDHTRVEGGWGSFTDQSKKSKALLKFLVGDIVQRHDWENEDHDGDEDDQEEQQPHRRPRYITKGQLRNPNGIVIREFSASIADSAVVEQALLNRLDHKRIASRAVAKVLFHLGKDCSIAAQIMNYNSRTANPTYKKLGPHGEQLQAVRRHFSVGNPDVELKPKSDMMRAYRYGRNVVPISDIDQGQLKFKSVKGVEVMGFVDAYLIPTQLHMNATKVLAPIDSDEMGKQAMASLLQAMDTSNVAVLLRVVLRDNGDPQLCAGFPPSCDHAEFLEAEEEGEDDGARSAFATTGGGKRKTSSEKVFLPKKHGVFMYIVQLPFAEDLRRMRFPDFSHVRFNSNQKSAVDNLIDSMSLDANNNNDDVIKNSISTFYEPSHLCNPVIQMHFYMIREKIKNGCFLNNEKNKNKKNSKNNMMMMNGQNNDSDHDDDDDDEEYLQIPEHQWHVPASIRSNSCCWGQDENILQDFFDKSAESRRRVRWIFPSNVDVSSIHDHNNTNDNNSENPTDVDGSSAIFMNVGGGAGKKRAHDFVANKLNGTNNKNNNNNNNTAAWFAKTEQHLKFHRSEDQNELRNLRLIQQQQENNSNFNASSTSMFNTSNMMSDDQLQFKNPSSSSASAEGSVASIFGGDAAAHDNMARFQKNQQQQQQQQQNQQQDQNTTSVTTCVSSNAPRQTFLELLTKEDNINNTNNTRPTTISRTSLSFPPPPPPVYFSNLCSQLEEIITEQLLPLGSIVFPKIVAALEELRSQCFKRGFPNSYNNIIQTIFTNCIDLENLAMRAKTFCFNKQRQNNNQNHDNDENEENDDNQNDFVISEEELKDEEDYLEVKAQELGLDLNADSPNFIDFSSVSNNFSKKYFRSGIFRYIVKGDMQQNLQDTENDPVDEIVPQQLHAYSKLYEEGLPYRFHPFSTFTMLAQIGGLRGGDTSKLRLAEMANNENNNSMSERNSGTMNINQQQDANNKNTVNESYNNYEQDAGMD